MGGKAGCETTHANASAPQGPLLLQSVPGGALKKLNWMALSGRDRNRAGQHYPSALCPSLNAFK